MSSGETYRGLIPGDIVCGRYKIVRRTDSGSMGEIFVADDAVLHCLLAIKVPKWNPEFADALRARLRIEASLARSIAHPNVCRVHDLLRFGDLEMLTMELIDGETLSSKLRRESSGLDMNERSRIAYQLCAGLAAVHRSGVIHRDIKPSNVMIDRHGRTVIIDFGIADRVCAPASPKSGTRSYMAPEQLLEGAVTPRCDIFGLGLVLYELHLGRRPFVADSNAELLRCHERGPVFPEGEERLEPALEDTLARCLAMDPGERPASAYEVAELLPGDIQGVFHLDGGLKSEQAKRQAQEHEGREVAVASASFHGLPVSTPARRRRRRRRGDFRRTLQRRHVGGSIRGRRAPGRRPYGAEATAVGD